MLFHDVAVSEQVLGARRLDVGRVRMIVGNDDNSIAVRAGPVSTGPAWRKALALTVHPIVGAGPALAIHRVLVAAYVAVVRRIGVGEIASRDSAGHGAIACVGATGKAPERGAAHFTRRPLTFDLRCVGASPRAVHRLDRGERLVFASAVLTSSCNHGFSILRCGSKCK